MGMTAVTYWPHEDIGATDESAERATKWAAANGLNAFDIPAESPVVVDGDQLTVTLVVERPEPGDILLPKQQRIYDHLDVRRTVPLVEPPPAELFRPCEMCLTGRPHSHH